VTPADLVSPRTEPRWQRRKDARPAELLAAALEVFTEKGYAGARLDDIAARAGVSKGTLYLYFANKEELFQAVVRDGLVSPLAEARAVIDAYAGPAAELLRFILLRCWERIGATRLIAIPKLIVAEAANFPDIARFYFREVIAPTHAALSAIVARGVARGEFRPVDPAIVASLIAAPFMLVSAWRFGVGPVIEPALAAPGHGRALLDAHIDMLLRGLGSAPAETMR
jgi:AcrR family transcriptional regulator